MQISCTLLHNTVGSVLCRYLGHYFCCTILQAVVSVLFRYLGRYFAAHYCRQYTMQISWTLLSYTILQAAYYVDILITTFLYNIVGSVLCRYVGRYFAAQYCRQRTMQISWSLLCCTILQEAYYVDILVITFCTAQYCRQRAQYCRRRTMQIYLGHYFAAQYCRQRTMQISLSLLYCTILQAAYYVDILVVTLLHNIVGSVLCCTICRQVSWSLLCCTILQAAYYVDILVHYFPAQYCKQRTMQISWSLLCCTILQAAYYVDILVITLLSQYCRQRTMQISWSLLCCTILQAAYYVDILVITFLHNIIGSVLCRYLGHYFAAQYCRQRTMQIFWSITLLQLILQDSVLCRYLGRYFASQYCRSAYYVDILVITLLHNIVGRFLCRLSWSLLCWHNIIRQHTMQISWSRYFAAQYCNVSVLCRYFGRVFTLPAQYCRQFLYYVDSLRSYISVCCTKLYRMRRHYVDPKAMFGHYFPALTKEAVEDQRTQYVLVVIIRRSCVSINAPSLRSLNMQIS